MTRLNAVRLLLLLFLGVKVIEGCKTIQMVSEVLGSVLLQQIPIDNEDDLDVMHVGGGRASYVTYDEKSQKSYYLYHTISPLTSSGNWVFNDEFGVVGAAIAYRYSWSVAPHLIDYVNDDENYWVVPSDEGWRTDSTMNFICVDTDDKGSVVYFESSPIQPTLTGFYVERTLTLKNTIQYPVYSHIPQHESIESSFLFKYNDLWMIGEDYSVDSGYAYIISNTMSPVEINATEWNFVSRENPELWLIDTAYIYSTTIPTESGSREFPSVYEAVRYAHSLKFIPRGQEFISLRNGVPLPVVGLGTGGIWHENAHSVFSRALHEGYRFFDLAREYGNEHVLPEVFEQHSDSLPVSRNDVFIQSKVWPTDLGYHPTMDALLISLDVLKTNYIDAYLLHWPSCDSSISWMHCETTVDPEGTWKGSWRALEKAYSEGVLNSIGVSNFNADLLKELLEYAIVKPHIIQNFAEPGRMDLEVRQLCAKHKIVYQPYASGRNIRFLPQDIQASLNRMATKYSTTPYAVILKFLVQTGNLAAIPRTNNVDHLAPNLQVFDWTLDNEEMEALGWRNDASAEL